MHIAIIGAGMAGLACADTLVDAGHSVALFDKGRGPGGRMSTRRLESPLGPVAIDHGAQYFTARDAQFMRLVETWQSVGIAAPWPEAGPDAWVGLPGMNAPVRAMAARHQPAWASLVTGLACKGSQWFLNTSAGEVGPFDAAVVAVPSEQAAAILSLHDLAMARAAMFARSQPCWTALLVFDAPLVGLPPLIRQSGHIAWASRNLAKPGRSGPEAWVVQANAAWSAQWLEAAPDEIVAQLSAALGELAGVPLPQPAMATAHRWRFALSSGTGEGALWNGRLALGACGDWLLGPRIECAWLSGCMLGRIIAAHAGVQNGMRAPSQPNSPPLSAAPSPSITASR